MCAAPTGVRSRNQRFVEEAGLGHLVQVWPEELRSWLRSGPNEARVASALSGDEPLVEAFGLAYGQIVSG